LFLERLLLFEEITARLFPEAPVPVDGFMHINEQPGMGLTPDLDFVAANDESNTPL